MNRFQGYGRGFKPLPRLALLAGIVLPLAACDLDDVLSITDPDIADPASFSDSTALPAFRGAALGDFSVAYDAAAGDNQIDYSGMLADEFVNSETFPTRIEIDRRDIDERNASLEGVTRNLYRARTAAESGIAAYQRFSPGGAANAINGAVDPGNVQRSELFSLAAATYILFAENYCSGVPFSVRNPDDSFSFGGQETTQQILERALSRADSAIEIARRDSAFRVTATSAAATAATLQNLRLGRVLRARALLNLGRFEEAGATAATVPVGFNYTIAHSENTARQNNGIFAFTWLARRVSAANNEGGNGLPYRTSGDPRTATFRPAGSAGRGFDDVTPQFNPLKYGSRSAGTPLATGIEARLIVAEAQLRAGGNFLATLNALRPDSTGTRQVFFNDPALAGQGGLVPANTVTGLDRLTDPGTPAGRADLLFRERAYWLWLTSHRLGDLRRLIRQYGRDDDNVFPTGQYFKGGVYGDDVNFPLTVDERNNTEFAGFPTNQSLCLNRDA